MKKFILTVAIIISSALRINAQSYYGSTSNFVSTTSTYSISSTNSSVRYQRGYTRTNGTYVQGHYKTYPNSTNHDNFSTRGNTNIYTGSIGNIARDYSFRAYNYGSGKTIHSGPRGGQYYINSKGNKTYVPKRR